MLASLKFHAQRLSYHLGRRFLVGSSKYKVRGYYANPFALRRLHEPHLVKPMHKVLSQHTGAFIDIGVNMAKPS